MSERFEEILNLYLSIWSTTQYGDDIKAMTFYNEYYEICITIFSAG